VAEIERDLSTNSPASTLNLIRTLKTLHSHDLYYACALVRETEAERLMGQPKYDTFRKIVRELARRGGEPISQAFKQVLLEEKLGPPEKNLVRRSLREEACEDAPFTLLATDRTQTREYLLRFDPKKSRTVVVLNGDTLVQIARRAYPRLRRRSQITFTSRKRRRDESCNSIRHETLPVAH
jgi:hypothetical protein